ncbi:YD repeat-containing protein [Paraburkholderia sp. GAS199]|uniref:colicin E5-related ribonuclease n=1 Tax=Paraburkholderia sp. GAS199 TaxID=3035126 RepID=UPI003D25F421
MNLQKRSFGPTRLLAHLIAAFMLLLVVFGANAESGDGVCAPLYVRSGAVQGTSSCYATAWGNTPINLGNHYCVNEPVRIKRWCGTPPNSLPEKTCPIADPIHASSGATTLSETDFASGDDTPMFFRRTYRARPLARPDAGLGSLWFHNWQRQLNVSNANSGLPQIIAYRENGDPVTFNRPGSTWRAADGEPLSLVQTSSSWLVTDLLSNTTESYSTAGLLLSVSTQEGVTTTLSYSDSSTPQDIAPSPGLLTSINRHAVNTNPYFDLTITLTYDSQWRITQMTDPTGGVTRYGYDGYDNLISVTWPDGNVRRYVYDDSHFTSALTGVIDEKGSRIATWTYDASGRAIAVTHPDTARNVQMAYDASSTTINNSQRTTTLNFLSIAGQQRPVGTSAGSAKTWDAGGNLLASRAANGTAMEYTYDDLARPTSVVQRGSTGTAKISIQYANGSSARPSMVASAGWIRAYVYDENGNLTGLSEGPTDDATGANGFDAHLTGSWRTWGMVYDGSNQVNFIQQKQGDVPTGAWGITHDGTGNLRSIIDRMGGNTYLVSTRDKAHRANIIQGPGFLANPAYDARGRLSTFWYNESASAANGNVTRLLKVTYTYSADGRIASRDGTVSTNMGADTAISSDETDQWLDNYENRVFPAGPPINSANSLKAPRFIQEAGLEPVCVECWIPPVRTTITGILLIKPYFVKDTKSCDVEPSLVQTVIEAKIAKQMKKRGWTEKDVEDTIDNPARTTKTRDTRNLEDGSGRRDDPATAYVREDGSYVVRNDVDGTIVQVSNRNDPNWQNPF